MHARAHFSTLSLAALLALATLLPARGQGVDAVAIYRGTALRSTTADGKTSQDFTKRFVVISADGTRCATIDFGRFDGIKGYDELPEQTLEARASVAVTAKDAKIGSRYAVASAAPGIEFSASTFLHGTTGRAEVAPGIFARLPKRLKGTADAVFEIEAADDRFEREKSKLGFHGELTRAANAAGDTFEQAVARVIVFLENNGYAALP
jgi:hypothetical protein